MENNLRNTLRQIKDPDKLYLIKGILRKIISCKEEFEVNVQMWGQGKPNYIMPKISTFIKQENDSFTFCYLFDDVRAEFHIEEDINDSYWVLVTKEKYGNIKACGKLKWSIRPNTSWASINYGIIDFMMFFIMSANDWKEIG